MVRRDRYVIDGSRVERLTRRRRRHTFVSLGVALVIVAVGALLLFGVPGGVDDPAPTTRVEAPEVDTTTENLELAACRDAASDANHAVDAADSSIDQWQLHIDAMNQLVAGEITLDGARKFWAKSKVKSKEKAHAFRVADQRYREGEKCTAPDTGRDQRTACAARVKAANQPLSEARTAVKQWEHHIHAMDLEADGKLTPAQVTKMWLASWKAGIRQVGEYEAAAGKYRGLTGCLP